MKRRAAIPLLVVLFIVTSAFQTRTTAPLVTAGSLTLSTNDDSRATFETVARSAGFRVVFSRDFVPQPLGPFQVDNKTVIDTLNLLSERTRSFWTIWESNTILVAPDTQSNRLTYDRLFIGVLEINRQQDPRAIVETVKGALAVGNKLVLKGTFAGIEKAKQAIAEVSGTPPESVDVVFVGSTDETFLSGGGSTLRSTTSKRSQLRINPPGRVTIKMADTHRAIYERLGGSTAGLNIIFVRNYPNRSTSFQVEDVDFFEALDLLSLQTRSLWQPINKNTIQILEDTLQNRRDFELRHSEIIYLSEGTTEQRLNEVINALRTLLNLRGIYMYAPRKAIVLQDTPSNILLAEDLIAALEGTPTLSKAVIADLTNAFAETGSAFRTAPAIRSTLKLRIPGTLPFAPDGEVRSAYEAVAQAAGFSVIFGARLPARSVNFRVEEVDAVDALDLLALQTGTFWQPLDERTVLVMEDNQQNRRDYERHLIKTILLPITTTASDVARMLNLLRTAFSLRGVYQSETAKAIVIHDTPNRVALVETVVRQLSANPNAIVSLTVPVPGYAGGGVPASATTARSQLDFTSAGAISMQLNQDARAFYETLAQMGRININFDPRFNAGVPVSLRIEGVDVPDALDRLSVQTGNYWTVLDRKTVLVAPNTAQVRQQIDPQISRVVSLKMLTQGLAGELVPILRTVLQMREVEVNGAYSISMRDTPQRIAIAEQIIANLDRP